MDLYGCHFEYAGELSRKYGLIIANVNTERNILLSGSIQTVSAFNKKNNVKHSIGKIYSEAPFVFEMEVVAEEPIESDWRRKIQKWLFNQQGYQKLYIDSADNALGEVFKLSDGKLRRTYLNCKFINPEKIEGSGGIVGYKFVVECDSHLAWQDPTNASYILTESPTTITVTTDTDSDFYTYPKVTLTTGSSGGDVSILNLTDNDGRATRFVDIPANTSVIINGAYNFVSDGYYESFVNRNFPRLLDGKNELSISGDIISIEFEWQNMRYL